MIWWLVACADPLERVLARDGDAEAGAVVFEDHCASCHGEVGEGTEDGPDLRDEDDTVEELADKVLYGWGEMEGFEGELSAQEVADVVAFVGERIQRR